MPRPPKSAAARRYSLTVQALRPLYRDREGDAADAIVGNYPHTMRIVKALTIFIDVMFPGKMSPGAISHSDLQAFLERRIEEGTRLLRNELARALPFRWLGECARHEGAPESEVDVKKEAAHLTDEFVARLPTVRELLIEDVKAAYEGDPAALTYAEVQLAYPGLLAISAHRLAHELYKMNVPIVPRVMNEWTHSRTGIDIHPGARIGHGFFIDHGTGVVIGETTVIGNEVKIYQGVTLGAKSFPLDENGNPIKHIKRHPTVEDRVVIYAHATILGGNTVIGTGATVGGNVFLTSSVPPNSVVSAIHPDLNIKRNGENAPDWVI